MLIGRLSMSETVRCVPTIVSLELTLCGSKYEGERVGVAVVCREGRRDIQG